jgi:phosphoribosylformylglycinamidine cyclo-ligase
VGMIAVVSAERAGEAVERLGARGVPSWVAGTVAAGPPPSDAVDVVRGAKGVSGGAVVTVGQHAPA